MKLVITIFLCLMMTSLWAEQNKKFEFQDYKQAKEATDYIRFQMKSTKMGLVTSHFTGYAKKFEISYDLLNSNVKEGKVSLQIKDLDTDVKGRNKKMWDYCLQEGTYNQLQVSFSEILLGEEKEVPAKISIRGKSYDILLKIKVTQDEKGLHVSGSSRIGLKELEIPDPSILIARVNNQVDIEFQVTL
ncbi:MAG: YceI family protein [Bacteriovoracaceae bacterium]|nr:YceI family protein [Bacteriovoracaceae bacterium]